MQQKYWLTLLLLFLVPGVMFAQSGKIRGTVVDQKTKELLIGANIIVEATNMGASTDVDGAFTILNVPIGTYTIKASYVGFRTFTISNIHVSVALTTEVKFELSSEDVQVQTVEIVAERPLVNRNATNATRFTTAEDIENLPVRGVANLISLSPGVVLQNNTIYIRGGRQDQVGYIIDGVSTRDPLLGGNTVAVPNSAIEEIQVQSGGYNAEYGAANAGLVIMSTKTGGEKLKASAEVITDGWGGLGKKSLGTYSYGYSEYILSLSGPLIPNSNILKFYFTGDRQYNGTSTIRYEDPINLPGIYDATLKDALGNYTKYDINYPGGMLLKDTDKRWNFSGNIIFSLKPFEVKVGGSYFDRSLDNGATITQIFNLGRIPITDTKTMTGLVHIGHNVSPTTFYEVNFSYLNQYQTTYDPIFKDQWWLYGDSVASAAHGITMKSTAIDPEAFPLFGINFDAPGTLESGYAKNRNVNYGVRANLTHLVGKVHEFKAGFDYTYYTMRNWNLAAGFCQNYALSLKNNPTETPLDLLKSVRLTNYGYDIMGTSEVDDGTYKPYHPVFASGYIQDKIEMSDLVINAGLRYDYIDLDQLIPTDPTNIPFDANGIMDITKFVKSDKRSYVSPRLGFSFSLSDQTVFHAQWGRFVQQSRLRDIYLGLIAASANIKGGNAIQNNIGWNLRPEQTINYELGFNQMLTDNSSFDITVYYRDITDQVEARLEPRASGAPHQSYFVFQNADFSTTKGIEFKFTLRRTKRLMAQAYYSYSDALGTGSNSSTSFRSIWQSPTGTPFLPLYVTPLDFNQTDRGNVNLDYRWAENDGGPILSRLGLNLLFSFNSGHAFTRIGEQYGNTRIPTEEVNASTTPWVYQLDLRIDKTFIIGPLDLNVYVWVINVLNTRNVTDVNWQTGNATDDAYLTTDAGKLAIKTYGEQYANFYRALLANGYNFSAGQPVYNNYWGDPRQIRLGLRIDY